MRFVFISLFPEIIRAYFSQGILSRASQSELVSVSYYNPRDYSHLPHKHVDDHPYGGGSGMIIRADILKKTLTAAMVGVGLRLDDYDRSAHRVILLSASGKQFKQSTAREYAQLSTMVFICGRYEGIDQRFIDLYVDDQISVGEYVVSGGEAPAMLVADAISRLIPGVLGNPSSLVEESFSDQIRHEYPQYTRPAIFDGTAVPSELISGNHSLIKRWRDQFTN